MSKRKCPKHDLGGGPCYCDKEDKITYGQRENIKPKITEIIPDNMPEWMREAMAEGQYFNRTLARIIELEEELARLK
jgi:hypothetical protein